MGLTYNRFHVTASARPPGRRCSPGATSIASASARSPSTRGRSPATPPPSRRAAPRSPHPQGERLRHRRVRQVASHARQRPGRRRTVRPLAQSWGFDHWWGFLSGAAGQYDPIITQDNSTLGVPQGKDGKQYYFPDDLTDKAVEWLHARPGPGRGEAVVHVLLDRLRARAAPRAKEWADKYKGKFDDGWDKLREQTFERQKELGVIPQDTELTERPDAFPAWDSLDDDAEEAVRPADGGVRRLPGERRLERRPAAGRDRGDGRPRQHARSSTSGATTARAWRGRSPARSTR